MSFLVIIFCGLFFFMLGRNLNCIINVIKGKRIRAKKIKEEYDNNDKKYNFKRSDDLKMVFLVRQDLKMKAGKIASQVAHAALGLYDDIIFGNNEYQQEALVYWVTYGQKKIVLKVPNLETMNNALNQCQQANIANCLITDPVCNQIPPGSKPVLGIGPDKSEKINKITGKFKLMS